MEDPTIAAVGETVIVGAALAALAEPARRATHSKAAAAAKEMSTAFKFEGHFEKCISLLFAGS